MWKQRQTTSKYWQCYKFYGKRFATDSWYFSTDISFCRNICWKISRMYGWLATVAKQPSRGLWIWITIWSTSFKIVSSHDLCCFKNNRMIFSKYLVFLCFEHVYHCFCCYCFERDLNILSPYNTLAVKTCCISIFLFICTVFLSSFSINLP